jgi:hypothetical protein
MNLIPWSPGRMRPSDVWYAARVIFNNMVPFYIMKKIVSTQIKYFIFSE